jgi:hypothetical protein
MLHVCLGKVNIINYLCRLSWVYCTVWCFVTPVARCILRPGSKNKLVTADGADLELETLLVPTRCHRHPSFCCCSCSFLFVTAWLSQGK